jgi:azobenzene reductase
MRIVIVSGSHRQNSQSLRVSKYLEGRIAALGKNVSTDIVELTGNPLPLWDESMWQASSDLQKQWQPYSERLKAADGFVIVSPEWSGMSPAGLKNFFLYCSMAEIGHKAALITTVSAGLGGAFPVNELRTSSYKNTRLCYIPEHLIIRNVEHIFVGDAPASKEDEYLRARADFALKILLEYVAALKPVRDSGVTVNQRFSSGMS